MRSHEKEQKQNRLIVIVTLWVLLAFVATMLAAVLLGVYALADLVF